MAVDKVPGNNPVKKRRSTSYVSVLLAIINMSLILEILTIVQTFFTSDVTYVELLKENVMEIPLVQIVPKGIKNVYIQILIKGKTLFNRIYFKFGKFKPRFSTKIASHIRS